MMLTYLFSSKKVFLLIVLLLCFERMYAQEGASAKHLVKLKNGQTIKGEILDMNTNQLIILDEQKVEHTLASEEVLKVSTLKPTRSTRLREEKNTGKYVNHTEFGIITRGETPSNTDYIAFSFRNFSGYQIKHWFSPGGSIGIDAYPVVYTTNPSVVIFPLTMGFRGSVLPTKVSPFYTFDIGYGFARYDKRLANFETRGGLTFNSSLGIKINMKRQIALTMALGYKIQKSSYQFELVDFSGNVIQINRFDQHFKRASLLLGFLF